MHPPQGDCRRETVELKRALFIVTPEYTGATTATRAIAAEMAGEYQAFFAEITPGPSSRRLISDAIDRMAPDVLFCSFSALNPDVIMEGKGRGLTVIVRSDYKLSDLNSSTLNTIKRTYPLAEKVLVQTQQLKEELITFLSPAVAEVTVWKTKIDKQDLVVKAGEIPSPFPNNGNTHFLWVGRYAPIKDLTTLIKAFKLVRKDNNAVELYLVGEKREEINVQGVKQIGFQENPYPWIKNADCLILSSKSEAQPNVVRESAMLGTDVISSKCFIPSDELKNNIEWFDVGDYQSLANLMINKARGNK